MPITEMQIEAAMPNPGVWIPKRKITAAGQPCSHCGTPVALGKHKKRPRYKPGGHYYSLLLKCPEPSCNTTYTPCSGKVFFDSPESEIKGFSTYSLVDADGVFRAAGLDSQQSAAVVTDLSDSFMHGPEQDYDPAAMPWYDTRAEMLEAERTAGSIPGSLVAVDGTGDGVSTRKIYGM